MLEKISTENAVLFLGSGFSTEAKNALDKSPPSGHGFKVILARKLGVDHNDYTLADLAESYAASNPDDFVQLSNDLFRTRATSANQNAIVTPPWLRIYTTNFDDVGEFILNSAGKKASSFTFLDPKPNKILPDTIVHLHGSIRDVNADNALEKIVPGEKSYVRQHLEKSHWYDQFLYDIKFAEACYFVGYSLADQHIAALLMKSPQLRSKTFFIEPDRIPDRVFVSRIKSYGEIEPIGLEGFATLCKTRIAPSAIQDFRSLKAFRLLETHPDKKSVTVPTLTEIRDFLIHGRLSPSRLMSTLPQSVYAIPRSAEAEKAADLLDQNTSIIVDGRLGNGKTVFHWLLFNRLVQKGYRCVSLRIPDNIPHLDLSFLAIQQKLVIFIENYTSTQEVIAALHQALPNAKFVIEVRTSIYEVRLFEVEAKIPKPYARVSLNRLSDTDYKNFDELCRAAGISVNITTLKAQRGELRELLLNAFDNAAIKDKIRSDLQRSFANPDAKRIIIIAFLLQLVQAPIDAEFLRLITGTDPFSVLRLNVEDSEEFFSLAEGNIALRSPVFAEFSIREFVSTKDLADAVHDCAVFCANRKDTPRFRQMLTAMTQFTRLREAFSAAQDPISVIRSVYERLRWYPNIKDEPLFWLQYCILEIDAGNTVMAKSLIDFAYDKAKLRGPTYKTYQIDTQNLRILISLFKSNQMNSELFDDLIEFIDVVTKMISTDSHRGYAIKVLESLPEAVRHRAQNLNDGEKAALKFALAQAEAAVGSLPLEFSSESGSATLAHDFQNAVAELR